MTGPPAVEGRVRLRACTGKQQQRLHQLYKCQQYHCGQDLQSKRQGQAAGMEWKAATGDTGCISSTSANKLIRGQGRYSSLTVEEPASPSACNARQGRARQ